MCSGVPRVFGARGEDGKWHPLPPACRTGKRRRRSPLLSGGSGAEPQPPTLFGIFGCKWNPLLNFVNTIFNSACQTGKRRRGSASLLWDLGRSPRRQRLWENLDVNGTNFSIVLTTFSTLLAPTAGMQPAAHIVIVSFGNSRRGAAARRQWYRRPLQAHIWGLMAGAPKC